MFDSVILFPSVSLQFVSLSEFAEILVSLPNSLSQRFFSVFEMEFEMSQPLVSLTLFIMESEMPMFRVVVRFPLKGVSLHVDFSLVFSGNFVMCRSSVFEVEFVLQGMSFEMSSVLKLQFSF